MPGSATPPKTELDSPTEKIHDDYVAPATANNNYVTGWKLTVVCVAVALACFLMLIDTMIISTVNALQFRDTEVGLTLRPRLFPLAGHPTHHR
jgi:hypothetical protein